MALATSRIVLQGTSPWEHERKAIDFAIAALPNTEPYTLWGLVELLDPAMGRLLELDLLILGYSALYHVEVKGGPGRYEGDQVDWWRTPPDGPPRWMDPPLRRANAKARVLKSLLSSKMRDRARAPRVEALIFLSHPDADISGLRPEGRVGVVTRRTFERAITHHDFPGSPPDWQRRRIDAPLARDIVQALAAIGVRARKGTPSAGPYELGEVLAEGPGYQDRLATHREQRRIRRRARAYLVPQQTSVERRQQLRRAADREAQLLHDVREHPNVLSSTEYLTDAPLGPTVLFDLFEGGEPLGAFLRKNPDLPFLDRVAIVEQVGRALSFCHRKDVFHGAVSPESVLVRRKEGAGGLEVRLYNFQLGAGRDVEATSHWSALAAEPWSVYQAPELRTDPPSTRNDLSDLWSLGALAYFAFTGRAPAESLKELDERLARDRCLDPRAVDETVPNDAVDVVKIATAVAFADRAEDVDEWVEFLLDVTTRPAAPEPTPDPDPLEAGKGAVLGGDLTVRAFLGHGASARVLEVEREADGRVFALKVSLGPEHDARLEREAEVLAKLRHPRIVQLVERRAIAGRTCLLLSLAGEETLHRLLGREGSVSLDFASRYGDDLCAALEVLEEEGIVHRDIKPANLGVGSTSKGAKHLTLFDFSLADTPAADVRVGTASYRDPWVGARGRWDAAADRWSAAMTLHEALTGIRPTVGGTPFDPDARLRLSAERFDPSVRDDLVAFFTRALAEEAADRFDSARAMREAWTASFKAKPVAAKTPGSERLAGDESPETREARIAQIAPDTPVEALPLSPAARSALDRAGVTRMAELLQLPESRLPAMRGVGSAVAREIILLRHAWAHARAIAPAPAAPFFPSYRGEDLHVAAAGLDASVSEALQDAGLSTLRAVAEAPAPHLEGLAHRRSLDLTGLREALARENRLADERARPSTLEGWIESLLPRKKPAMRWPRALYGLEGPFPGRLDVRVREVAADGGVTTANVYMAISKCRDVWRRHPALDELRGLCEAVLAAAGGAAPVERAADELLARLPYGRTTDPQLARARAAATFRILVEVDKDDPEGLRYARLHDEAPWLFVSAGLDKIVLALGEAADDLAARPVLASPGEAARIFGDEVEGTPLANLPPERLSELAALASRRAARSTRLEIYPRDLAPTRALELCAALLASGQTPEQIQQRVRSRYPEAPTLPPRPALDTLLAPHGLTWSETSAAYERPGDPHGTSLGTSYSPLTRLRTALPAQPRSMEPDAIEAREFDERLRDARERRQLRVLGVTADRAPEAAQKLATALGVAPTSFDELLLREIDKIVKARGIELDVLHRADREGRGPGWDRLVKLAAMAAGEVAKTLLPPRAPLLLVQPGLLARYRLTGFVAQLVAAADDDESAAIFLLVPAHDTGGIPRINGELVIDGILASQALWVSPQWIGGKHKAAA